MKVTSYKTKLVVQEDSLFDVIASAIPELPERSVVVVASKIIATCEGRFVDKDLTLDTKAQQAKKHDLVRQEADLYTDPHSSKYDLMLTIKDNWMFVNAGIDESNAHDQYLLWPENPQKSANEIWQFLRDHYGLKEVGVTISDSSSMPLNWGVIGRAIAYCGFEPLKSYIGKPDLYGRLLKMEQVNVMQAVTAAGVLEMGEGNEQTPLAVAQEVRDIVFQDHTPTLDELASLKIELEDDAYAPLLTKVAWLQGEGGSRTSPKSTLDSDTNATTS